MDTLDEGVVRSTLPETGIAPAPEGTHDAVFVDWYDEGITLLRGRHVPCVRLVWQIAARRVSGRRFLVSRRFHKTLGPWSALRKIAERWLGRAMTSREALVGISLERWLGQPCRLVVTHRQMRDGGLWVNMTDLQPWDLTCGRHPLTPEQVIRHRELPDLPPWMQAHRRKPQEQEQS